MNGCLLHRPRLEAIKGWHLFLLLIACEALLTWVYQEQILTREVYHALLKEQLEVQRIDALFDLLERMNLWGYVAIPLVIGIRILFVGFLLQLPLVLRFIDIPFRRLFRIVAVASLPLILLEGIRLLFLAGIPAAQVTRADLNWIPLSLGSLLDLATASAATQGFFSHLNLFELGFLALLLIGLMRTNRLKRLDAALVVLLMWTVVILFQWGVTAYLERM
ncbi:MAG TPA: hypothetical protein PLN61_06300 [bacterium]|nr:hypothetical protein [bacterium]HQI48260.1 hypothetical protein [bacterium]HQJ65992.1 hypothetical protein [bacterium]